MATSTMLPLGTTAPGFALPTADGRATVALEDLAAAPALLVVFLSNHCPYVRHVERALGELADEYGRRGVATVGISSNDVVTYPEDAPPRLVEQAERAGFAFPYLYDERQDVARAYAAACTPDFFVFDAGRALAYRGQMDDSRPRSGRPVTGVDLRAALDAVLAGRAVPGVQKPSIGCSIKWRR